MKYLDLLLATEWLSRYYPKYYSNELMLLADDIRDDPAFHRVLLVKRGRDTGGLG